MSAPVSLVTIHHEGGGAPSDVARGADGGYTYWIGVSTWTWLRDVWSSYATKGANHISLDVCLSGNRMDHAVTDADLDLIAGACADARRLGYVVAAPTVNPHKATYSTACPGDNTMARWGEVVGAVLEGCSGIDTPEPEPEPEPKLEEVEMFVMTAPGYAARLCTGTACIPLKDSSSVAALNAANIPSVSLSARDYDTIMGALGGDD